MATPTWARPRHRTAGRRSQGVDRLQILTGAEATLVVNNNAQRSTSPSGCWQADGRSSSRGGEFVEIGGSFRMPDVMTAAGCTLAEVGTTNRTHLRDYEGALGPRPA